jgi:hypothetical protein
MLKLADYRDHSRVGSLGPFVGMRAYSVPVAQRVGAGRPIRKCE